MSFSKEQKPRVGDDVGLGVGDHVGYGVVGLSNIFICLCGDKTHTNKTIKNK